MSNSSKVELLIEAGLCEAKDLTEKDREQLERLTDEEAHQMINLHRKLGKAGSDAARPAFPV